jgi:hypothetical protein
MQELKVEASASHASWNKEREVTVQNAIRLASLEFWSFRVLFSLNNNVSHYLSVCFFQKLTCLCPVRKGFLYLVLEMWFHLSLFFRNVVLICKIL